MLENEKECNEYELQTICDIIDCPHTSPVWKESGIPVIRNYNLVNGGIDMTNLSYVDEEEYINRVKRVEPRENDILFSREAPIGNVAIIPANFKCCQGQRVVLLRVKSEEVLPKYLLYVLQGNSVRSQIGFVEGRGATVSNFNISDLKKLRVSFPSKKNQNEKVQIIDSFSDICNDSFGGLPAEIAARKKQFEYYREKLLAFKEAT